MREKDKVTDGESLDFDRSPNELLSSVNLSGEHEPEVWRAVSRYEFWYSIAGLAFGVSAVALGALLLIRGIAGQSQWTIRMLGLESSLTDATPGAILLVIGALVVYFTRFNIRGSR